MRIGTPREIKPEENRVGLVPASVRELTRRGHEVVIETGAGAGIGIGDEAYQAAGAEIAPDADALFARAELIVKVKEPQPVEVGRLTPQHTLFTFLHLAAEPELTRGLVNSGATGIALETVRDRDGALPLLAPMSEVAGSMAAQVAARCLEAHEGGRGLLMGGTPGTPPAQVTVIGGGMAGSNAAQVALGMGAEVTILDTSLPRLRELRATFGPHVKLLHATAETVEQQVAESDVVVGAVLVPGAAAPRLIDRSTLARMRPGAVLVDVAIDQGGCFATSKPTTHTEPTYTVDGIVHYAVTNMPGAVPRTSAFALNAAMTPYVLALADKGPATAMQADPGLAEGLNVYRGAVVNPAVAHALDLPLEVNPMLHDQREAA